MKLKTTILLAALLLLSGCGYFNRILGYASGYTTLCVKETNVLYVQFPSGAAVLVDKDGKPVTCK